MAPTAAEWRAIILDRYKRRADPFDGKRQGMLLAVAMTLSHTSRGSRVALKAARDVYGDRAVRLYVPVLVGAELLEMVVRPTRGKAGKGARVAVYEFRPGAESLPGTSTNSGSDSCSVEWHRSCSTEEEPDETDRARSVPLSTLKPSRLFVATTQKSTGTTFALRRGRMPLVPLAARGSSWAGWQFVAERATAMAS